MIQFPASTDKCRIRDTSDTDNHVVLHTRRCADICMACTQLSETVTVKAHVWLSQPCKKSVLMSRIGPVTHMLLCPARASVCVSLHAVACSCANFLQKSKPQINFPPPLLLFHQVIHTGYIYQLLHAASLFFCLLD